MGHTTAVLCEICHHALDIVIPPMITDLEGISKIWGQNLGNRNESILYLEKSTNRCVSINLSSRPRHRDHAFDIVIPPTHTTYPVAIIRFPLTTLQCCEAQ